MSNADKYIVSELQDKVDSAKQLMAENVDRLLERGENLDIIMEKSSIMTEQAQRFRTDAKTLRKKILTRPLGVAICACCLMFIILIIAIITTKMSY